MRHVKITMYSWCIGTNPITHWKDQLCIALQQPPTQTALTPQWYVYSHAYVHTTGRTFVLGSIQLRYILWLIRSSCFILSSRDWPWCRGAVWCGSGGRQGRQTAETSDQRPSSPRRMTSEQGSPWEVGHWCYTRWVEGRKHHHIRNTIGLPYVLHVRVYTYILYGMLVHCILHK